ncbi:MAG TPA: hypothetical protein ENK08_10265 [Chloroflexi bacterium]|nr:hypothetical protein [Chloroflexota bacterium]
MKRLWIGLILLGWLVLMASACVSLSTPAAPEGAEAQIAYMEPAAPRPTNTPFPRPTPRIPNRVYYTKRCWPACHLDPNYVHDSTKIFTDEFEGELEPGWTWLNEDPTHWSLEQSGALRIVPQPADLGRLEEVPNVLLRPAPESHFDLITQVSFAPTAEGQAAVLLIQTEEGEIISLIRGYCDDLPACVGSGICFATTLPDCAPVGLPFDEETATLMLRRSGNSYIGYVLDEGEWVEVGRCYGMLTPVRVGLTAINGSDAQDTPETPVDFDSFTLVERH